MSQAPTNQPFDTVAAWHTLSSEAQARIGTAAIAHVLGMIGLSHGLSPIQGFEAADMEGFALVEDELRNNLPAAFTLDDLPLRPDLSALGIRTCKQCGCTDACGCQSGCSWASDDVCSSCATPLSEALAQIRAIGGLSDNETELGDWRKIRGIDKAMD